MSSREEERLKAIQVETRAGRPVLVWGHAPDPQPAAGEVLIAVAAAGVNRADLAQAAGGYPVPPGASPVLGLEVAGSIASLGPGVSGEWRPGDRVCALLAGGGYAELAAADQRLLLRLPDAWTFAQGAAVPEAWLTAWVNLMIEGRLRAGESLLVHAGASGVGTAAIQTARRAGATVYATAGGEAKIAVCRELGAAAAFDRVRGDFAEAVLAATGGAGVDLVLDPVGGPYLRSNVRVLKEHGRLVSIGLLGGRSGELDLSAVLGRSLEIRGSRLRPRPLSEKALIVQGFARNVWPALLAGELRLIVDRAFPMAEAGAAHDYVRANRNTGKVILSAP